VNPSEICELRVGGKTYRDWKTILVYLCRKETANYYRFTCTEGMPLAKDVLGLQIRPLMRCTVILGGQPAIDGYVTTRQVAYTATHHGVEITGKTIGYTASHAAAMTPTGELVNKSFMEIANEICQPAGLKVTPKGGISEKKFPRVNVQGQTIWEVLDSCARARNIVIGPSPKPGEGNTFWATTPGFSEETPYVIEGKNILEGREILSALVNPGANAMMGQSPPDAKTGYGAEKTHVPHKSGDAGFGKAMGAAGFYAPSLGMMELPGVKDDVEMRTGAEDTASNSEQAWVEVVVQGWFRPTGGLWSPYDKIHVKSPMLIMDETLTAKSVTFTQDDRGGTRTTLEIEREITKPGAQM